MSKSNKIVNVDEIDNEIQNHYEKLTKKNKKFQKLKKRILRIEKDENEYQNHFFFIL